MPSHENSCRIVCSSFAGSTECPGLRVFTDTEEKWWIGCEYHSMLSVLPKLTRDKHWPLETSGRTREEQTIVDVNELMPGQLPNISEVTERAFFVAVYIPKKDHSRRARHWNVSNCKLLFI
ncbi:hypothetical protein MHYP_G00289670 [Metynnis hypsauchen]